MNVGKETMLEMYRRMVRIRQFELAAIDLFKRGQVKGAVHPYIGQEASGVGVCMALRDDDLIAGTHRSHGHNIAKNASSKKMMAEILGKEPGRAGCRRIGHSNCRGRCARLQDAWRGPRGCALHGRCRIEYRQLA
jgi:TPP-dependent pyruvate/acetoin dehydrogenase alpha subunit